MRWLLAAASLFLLAPSLFAADGPNIVILFCYGHPTIRTPNIDKMAAEGMKFTNFYAGRESLHAQPCTAPHRPGIAWWPGTIPAGVTTRDMA